MVFLIGFFIYLIKTSSIILNPVIDTNLVEDTSLPEVSNFPEANRVIFDGLEYAYAYFIVKNPNDLILVPNFAEQKSTQEIKKEKLCIAGINGGFYDEEKNPLGGFISERKIYKSPIKSLLLDGFLWIDKNQANITIQFPQESRISLQSGPLLVLDGQLTKLSIKNDKYARRSIAFITDKKELVFMIIFDPKNITSGPNLKDIPLILNAIDKKQDFFIQSAINLDGGNASAMNMDKISLLETKTVGSYFCLKNN